MAEASSGDYFPQPQSPGKYTFHLKVNPVGLCGPVSRIRAGEGDSEETCLYKRISPELAQPIQVHDRAVEIGPSTGKLLF